jgi:class 3 adenylate cyclase
MHDYMTDRFEPDLAEQLQSSIVPLLVDVVHRSRGTVNRVGGDGVTAIFGAPVAHEDDAVQACVAAWALHEAFERFTSRLGDDRLGGLALQIGLASSEVVLRRTSNDRYEEYTALGPAVRLATRLGQLAVGGTTLLTLETACAAEGYIRVRPLLGSRLAAPRAS